MPIPANHRTTELDTLRVRTIQSPMASSCMLGRRPLLELTRSNLVIVYVHCSFLFDTMARQSQTAASIQAKPTTTPWNHHVSASLDYHTCSAVEPPAHHSVAKSPVCCYAPPAPLRCHIQYHLTIRTCAQPQRLSCVATAAQLDTPKVRCCLAEVLCSMVFWFSPRHLSCGCCLSYVRVYGVSIFSCLVFCLHLQPQRS